MEKKKLLYEGKAKKVYQTDKREEYIVEFKDDATAFNGEKKGTITGKGVLNNQISTLFFQVLKEKGIKNHFIANLSPNEMLVEKVTILPLEVVVRNIAAGSLAKRLGLEEGVELNRTVIEFYFKNDSLGDPFVNESHILAMNWATIDQIKILEREARKINEILQEFLFAKNILLVDFKLEFGVKGNGEIILADEISPDTCRFWDRITKEKLDKDRFRRDLGNVSEAYQEILRRLGGTINA